MRARQLPLILVIGVLLLAGCVPQPAEDPVEPAPSSAPVFASEEEALAAAVAAYEEYLKVSDAIAADGGANPERLKDLVTEEWYEKEADVFSSVTETGLFQTGSTQVGRTDLQDFAQDEAPPRIAIYACTDFSGTGFVDASGAEAAPPGRPEILAFQVTFQVTSSGNLRLAGSEPWSEYSCS